MVIKTIGNYNVMNTIGTDNVINNIDKNVMNAIGY